MTHFIRAYLRASTNEQDAQRARGSLDRFAYEQGVVICNYYAENESGAHLKHPELFRLLAEIVGQVIFCSWKTLTGFHAWPAPNGKI